MSSRFDKFNVDDEVQKKILDFLPYPFLVSELQHGKRHNVFVNQKFIEEIGYSCEEIPTNDDWFRVAYPDPVYRQEVKDEWTNRSALALKNEEDSVFLRALVHTKKKGNRWYEVKSSVSGGIYLIAFIDIHDVHVREKELEKANHNKDKILSILGHDLRGPIRNLHALSSLMLDANMNKEEFLEVVKNVNSKAFQSMEFLDTTLVWTKSNFDKISINIEKVIPRALVEKILPFYKSFYESKKLTIKLDISPYIYIHSDIEILTIVIRNLISNAIKFTNENGVIEIMAEQADDFFYIMVKDNGIGMDKETLNKISDNHYSSSQGTQQETGLGLGLKLCKELLNQINGALVIESELQVGTTMKIKVKNTLEDY